MTKTLAAIAAALLTLTLTSCGNGDDSKAASNISADIMANQDKKTNTASQLFTVKKKQADCIGKGLVDKIGVEQLQKYKVLDKNLKAGKDITTVKMTKGDAGSATDTLFGCADIPAMVKKAAKSSGNIPASIAPCVDKALSEKGLRKVFTEVFQGEQQQAQKDLVAPLMKCAQPQS